MSEDIKLRINERRTAIGFIGSENGIFDIGDESKVRVVVDNAAVGNTVIVRGRIKGQLNFVNLKTISGNDNVSVNVFTYDEIQIECTAYVSASNHVHIVASSFNNAGGSAIELIGVPSGDNLTDIEQLTFTSSDSSVVIIGDNTSKSIDLKVSPVFGGSYVSNFTIASWVLGIGEYTLNIPVGTHNKGIAPLLELQEKTGSDHSPVLCDIKVNVSGDITITTKSSPDLRFDGRITIN